MRVLGIDPSLRRTGYGVVEGDGSALRLVEGGVIAASSTACLADRLAALQRGLADVISAFRPDVIAIEEIFSQRTYPRTAILMAHSRGALVSAAALAQVPVVDYAATSIKRALVGRGSASKDQVASMVVQALRLRSRPGPADVTDALAIAIAHFRRASSPAPVADRPVRRTKRL